MARAGYQADGIISDTKEILRELDASRQNGNLLGIWAPSLGKGIHICSIESIHDRHAENDKVIIVREKDLRGGLIQTNVLYLREIEKVHRFKTM